MHTKTVATTEKGKGMSAGKCKFMTPLPPGTPGGLEVRFPVRSLLSFQEARVGRVQNSDRVAELCGDVGGRQARVDEQARSGAPQVVRAELAAA